MLSVFISYPNRKFYFAILSYCQTRHFNFLPFSPTLLLLCVQTTPTMKLIWIAALFGFCFKTCSTITCHSDDACICIPGPDLEIQCPTEVDDIILHVDDDDIYIDCPDALERFQIEQLPNITIGAIQQFRMKFCPLPRGSFNEIVMKLGGTEVNDFEFSESSVGNTLTGDHFKGFQRLESLKLNNNNFSQWQDDVFMFVPNLQFLELQSNNLVLERRMFRTVPHLISLDISDNNIQKLPRGVFGDLKMLESLDILNNSLVELNEFSFENLKRLRLLELSLNRISTIHKNAFMHLETLTHVNLLRNNLKQLDPDLFRNNKKLKLVAMKYNPNLQLSDYLFSNLSIEAVDLSNCNLQTIPRHIFRNTTSLRVVKLTGNKLQSLSEDLFSGLVNMEKIYLNKNLLTKIPVLHGLVQLRHLHLKDNFISEIDDSAFVTLRNLKTLSLKRNRLKVVQEQTFRHNPRLVMIDLSHNGLRSCDLLENFKSPFSKPTEARHLDLSFNHIESLQLSKFQTATPVSVDLSFNNITAVDFKNFDPDQTRVSIVLSDNPISCDCFGYDLFMFLSNKKQPVFKNAESLTCDDIFGSRKLIVELPPEMLICDLKRLAPRTGCPKKCFCTWRPSDRSLIIDCSQSEYTELPSFDLDILNHFSFLGYTEIEVNFSYNRLIEGPSGGLKGYDNVTKLLLSHNQISTITWLPPKLKILQIDNNQIAKFDHEVLNILNNSNLVELTLGNNPWSCKCDTSNFITFLRQRGNQIDDIDDIYCVDTRKLIIHQSRDDLCFVFKTVYLIVFFAIVLFVTALLFALYQCHKETVKVWLYSHRLWISEDDVDSNKIYDIFISYAHQDEDFVVDDLVPVLDNHYKLCLHHRDWSPGEQITTHITNSVLTSRRTLVVLSPHFLRSVWGRMEFRTAHTHAIREGRTRVIVVVYGDPDLNHLEPELECYVKTKTYVQWDDPYFWQKLNAALPRRKRSVTSLTNEQTVLIE